MREIQVSDEYLDSLCDWMMEWVKKDSSLTIPQFLKERGIGYPYFKFFIWRSPKVNNVYEVMKSTLFCKWLNMGLYDKDLSQHKAKILMRYINLYDSHGFDLQQEAKNEESVATKTAELNYITENYAQEKLNATYQSFYDRNVNKRRDRKETK